MAFVSENTRPHSALIAGQLNKSNGYAGGIGLTAMATNRSEYHPT